MFLSKLAVRKPVLTTMLVSVFVVMGLFSYTRLTTELFPEVAFPVITVTTLYPGAGPNEVQSQLTELIEDEVVAISNVKRVNATSQEGVSVVLVEFELGVDVDLAAIEVKDKVDAIRFLLPEDSEPPSVVKFDIAATPVMDVTLSGARPVEELFQLADTQVKDAFARVGGVSSVTLVGGKEREIEVALNNRKLQDYDLSITDVVGAIAAANLSVPAGTIIQKDAEYGLRMVGEFTSVEELNEVYLINRRNETISLTDIGVVRDTFKDQRELARFNGNTSVGLTIQKRSDANVIETADGLNKEIAALRAALPSDISIDIISDGSTFIRSSVRDVLISIVVGIGLTSVILFLFLHNVRATIIAAIAMPTSIVATFILLDFAGFTLNLMSLLGLGISLGTLVANAIVVLENIARHVQEGKDPKDAAEIGTDEMVVAVLAATMTNVMVFTPIAFMAGLVGQFFRQFGLTVVFATLFSLLVSFTLTPMLASRLLRPASATKRKSLFSGAFRAWDAMYGLLERGYRGSLAWSLSHRVIVLGMTALVFAGGIYLFKFVGSEFVPTFDQGLVRVGLEMPAGTSLERTNLALERIEEIAAKVPEARDLYTTLGGGGGATGVEFGQVVINLKEDRQRDGTVILADLRESLVGTIPDAQLTFDLSQGSGGGGQADITIDVTGLELEPLSQLADAVTLAAKETPGTADVRASHKSGKPELAVQLDRRKLGELKLSVAQVGSALRTNYSGAIASTYREAGEEYDIRVRLTESDRDDIANVEQMLVKTQAGSLPLTELGTTTFRDGPTRLTRLDKQQLITVSANIAEGDLGSVVAAIQANIDKIDVPDGYKVVFGGQVEQQSEAFAEIFTALILAIILTYMLIGGILESFVHPITIMMTLPLGLIGASVALVTTGLSINLFSLMAIVMLVGIVVNNGILLLDYTGQLRQKGLGMRDALLEACPVRLRPIVMANLAIVTGMLPQALSPSGVAVVQASMATVMIGGVLISTVLTLFVVPVIYTMLDRFSPSPTPTTSAS